MVFGLFGGAKKRAAELYEAAQKGDLDGVRQALDKGADINALDPECSETALHAAVDKSQKAVVDLLLSKGANPDIVSGQHYTPLIIAAAQGDVALPMVESLLAGKANPELAPTTGPNAGGAPMHIAASNGSNAILGRLLAAGAKPKVLPNGSTLMHMAAIGGNAETVELVSKTGIPVDCTDGQSRTPLHLTGITGNSAVARKLLELGASVDKRDGEDCTPLMHAALQNKPNVVDLLLKKGANPDVVATNGGSVLSPLYGAAIKGFDGVVKLLLAAGVPADKKIGDFHTAAEMAEHAGHASTSSLLKDAVKQRKAAAKAEKSNLQAEQLLDQLRTALATLDYQSVIPLKDDKLFSKLPADWRLLVHTLFGEIKGVKEALKDGANTNAVLSDVKNGIPPLVAAAGIAKNLELVDMLLAAGADVNQTCSDGKTALMFAAENGGSEIVERLISAGANVNATLLGDSDEPLSGLGAFGLALNRARINIAKILIRNGARPDFGKVKTLPLVILEHGDIELVKAVESCGVQLISDDMRGRAAFVSARNPDGEVFDYVMNHGGDVSADNDYKYTALTLAVLNNHGVLVERYLARGDDPNPEDVDRETALSLAIEKGHQDIIKALRNHGAQVREYPGLSLEQTMIQAAKDGALGTILNLRDAGISLNEVDDEGNTPLILATKAGHLGVVRSLFHLGADIDWRNNQGQSAAKISKQLEDSKLIATMNEFLAEDMLGDGFPRIKTPFGGSMPFAAGVFDAGDAMFGRMSHPGKDKPPYANNDDETDPVQQLQEKIDQLHDLLENKFVAARIGEQGREMIEQLIPSGVINPEDVTDEVVQQIDQLIEKLTEVADSGGGENDEDEDLNPPSPLFEAIQAGDLKEVKKLIKAGCNPNETNEQGVSALMMAMMSGAEAVIDTLIKSEADVTYSMPDGKSALFLAIASGNDGLVKTLLKAGAQLDEIYDVDHNGIAVAGCSPLYVAAYAGQMDICRILLKEGADIEHCNDGGLNPLIAGIYGGHVDVVNLLLKAGADPDPAVYSIIDQPPFEKTSTPLCIATQKGDVSIVKALLSAKANVDSQDSTGWTPLKKASIAGSEELVKLFLKFGADPNIADETNYTPLINAASDGYKSVVEMLLKAGADPNIQTGRAPDDVDGWDEGRTALMDSAVAGHIEVVRVLLKHGANPNIQNVKGRTALHSAVISGNSEVVELLLKAGADVDITSVDDNQSALDLALRQWVEKYTSDQSIEVTNVLDLMLTKGRPDDLTSLNETALDLVTDGHIEVVDCLRQRGVEVDPNQLKGGASQLFIMTAAGDVMANAVKHLLDIGADPNYVSPAGLPVLSLAVRNGANEIVEALLAHGADVMARNSANACAYDLAVIYGHVDLIQLLISHMNQALSDCDRLDSEGNTALMRAVKHSDLGKVKELISLGANSALRDIHGDSALSFAVIHGLSEIEQLLRHACVETIVCDQETRGESVIVAARSGALGTILDLLDQGTDINSENSEGDTAVTVAEIHPGVIRVLASKGADLSHRNAEGKSAYMIAAASNRTLVMQVLQELGAPLDEPSELDGLGKVQAMVTQMKMQMESSPTESNDGADVTPDGEDLIMAAINGDTSTVRRQLSAGVEVDYENAEGRTALMYAIASLGQGEISRRHERDLEQVIDTLLRADANPNSGVIPSIFAIIGARRVHIVNALIRAGADLNATIEIPDDNDQSTSVNPLLLYLSMQWDEEELNEDIPIALVRAGIDLSFSSEDGSLAIHHAATKGFVNTLVEILGRAPDSVNIQFGNGTTALMAAAVKNQVGAIKVLLQANADRTIRDAEGKTALDIALAEGHQEAVAALR